VPIPDDHEAARFLREEFERVGRERRGQAAAPAPAPRRRLRLAAATLASVIGAAAIATAATELIDRDGVVTTDRTSIPPRDAPADETLSRLRVPDPAGGLPWGLRMYTSKLGLPCVLLGHVKDDKLGTVRGSRFLRYPARAPGSCATDADANLVFTIRRAANPAPGRAVLYGRVDRSVMSLTVAGGSGSEEPVEIAPDGAFLVVSERLDRWDGRDLIVVTSDGRRAMPLVR
jgi:hypothetical protein